MIEKDIKKLEKDYKGAIIDSIGESKQTGDTHFVFRKGNKYFGIAVKKFDTFEYKEHLKIKGE